MLIEKYNLNFKVWQPYRLIIFLCMLNNIYLYIPWFEQPRRLNILCLNLWVGTHANLIMLFFKKKSAKFSVMDFLCFDKSSQK